MAKSVMTVLVVTRGPCSCLNRICSEQSIGVHPRSLHLLLSAAPTRPLNILEPPASPRRIRDTARSFLDVPLEHELVRCLREARDGGISSNGSYEECNGRLLGKDGELAGYRRSNDWMEHDGTSSMKPSLLGA